MAEPADLKARAEGAGSGEGAAARALELAQEAREKSQVKNKRRKEEREEDARLVARAKDGDAPAFRRLVERNQSRLFAVAFGMLRDRDDAMDAVQDAFIRAHKKLSEFEGSAAFSTWLYRICVNLCIDKKRSDARRRSVDLDDVSAKELGEDNIYAGVDIAPKLTAANPLKAAQDKQLGKEIGAALAALSDDHRAILLLREVDGLAYEEISQVLEIPKGTVMSRLFHARRNMQRLLRPYLGLAEGTDPASPANEGNR
jgi:RNA polymerase sigma-70 factor, ECF subfamily